MPSIDPLESLTPSSVPSAASAATTAVGIFVCTADGMSYASNGRSTAARSSRKCVAISTVCVGA